MGEVRVAFAPADREAALDVVAHLKAIGFNASPANLGAGRAAEQTPPSVLVWSRHAAADARLRALLRRSKSAVLARIDAAPTPRVGAHAQIDWREPASRRARHVTSALGAPATVSPAVIKTSAAPVAATTAPAPAGKDKKKSGGAAIGILIGLIALAAAAASAAWALGYIAL